MNYQKHYDSLIKKAQSRAKPEGYTERHHIMPRSMGGSNDKSNLVDLTAREHFVAHYLFAKVHGGKQWNAVILMKGGGANLRNGKHINARLYEAAKQNQSAVSSQRIKSNQPMANPDFCKKVSDSLKRKYKTDEDFRKRMEAVRETTKTPESKAKQSANNCNNNPEVRAKKSLALKTSPKAIAQREKLFANNCMKNPETAKKCAESNKNSAKMKAYREKNVGGNHSRAIKVLCVETGVVYGCQKDAIEWVRANGYPKASKGSFCNAVKLGKTIYGYTWGYAK